MKLLITIHVLSAIAFVVLFLVLSFDITAELKKKWPAAKTTINMWKMFIQLLRLIILALIPIVNVFLLIMLSLHYEKIKKDAVVEAEREMFFRKIEM